MASAKKLGATGTLKLDDAAFGAPFNGPLVHESVRAEQAARRQGTHSTKTRGLVRGGGAKPWRQKGTGRARAGSSRSPVWTGGGTVFGPSPRNYTFKVNRKERRAALRSALSVHAERGTIHVLDPKPFVDEVSTKQAAVLLGDLIGGDAAGDPDRRAGAGRAVVPQHRAPQRAARRGRRRLGPHPRERDRRLPGGDRRADRARHVGDQARRRADRGGDRVAMDASQVIIRPVVSEKSYVLADAGRYTFRVHPDAHKTQIRQAVEQLFDVKVVGVRTASVKSKPKRRGLTRGPGRARGRRPSCRCARGDSIPIFQTLQGLDES